MATGSLAFQITYPKQVCRQRLCIRAALSLRVRVFLCILVSKRWFPKVVFVDSNTLIAQYADSFNRLVQVEVTPEVAEQLQHLLDLVGIGYVHIWPSS